MHLLAHVVLFVGFVVLGLLVPSAYRAVMRLGPTTYFAGFVGGTAVGITHLLLAVDASWRAIVVGDSVAAVALTVFAIGLALDLRKTIDRFEWFLTEVREDLGTVTADRVTAIWTLALTRPDRDFLDRG